MMLLTKQLNLIPIPSLLITTIFKGVKRIVEDGYGSIIRKLIQNNINLIALHTNLDVNPKGVNRMLADQNRFREHIND